MAEPPRFLPLFAAALAVRLGTVLLGILMAAQRPDARPADELSKRLYAEIDPAEAWPVGAWYRADALWVVHVAAHGYAGAAGPDGQHGAAFLPMLPALLALAGLLGLNVYWVGVLLPNVAAAAGMAVFTRLAVRLTGDRAAGLRAFVLLNAFPAAFFLSAPYQEGFGLLFTALALSAWHTGRVGAAGAAAGVGCVARVTVMTVGVAALGAWVFDRMRTWSGLARAAAVAGGCAAGVLAVLAVMWVAVGDPLAGVKAHEGWGRRSPSLGNVVAAVRSVYDPVAPRALEGGLALVFAGLGVWAWRKWGAFWGLVTLLPIAQMASSGTFLSGHRVLLAALPGFVALAALLRNRLVFLTAVALGLVVQLFLLNAYVHWGFAG